MEQTHKSHFAVSNYS